MKIAALFACFAAIAAALPTVEDSSQASEMDTLESNEANTTLAAIDASSGHIDCNIAGDTPYASDDLNLIDKLLKRHNKVAYPPLGHCKRAGRSGTACAVVCNNRHAGDYMLSGNYVAHKLQAIYNQCHNGIGDRVEGKISYPAYQLTVKLRHCG